MVRGVIVGKFYPPHRGHKYLIDTARKQCDYLTVFVCRKAGEVPSADVRGEWLREIHPDVNICVIEDIGLDDDSKAWADYTIALLGYAPDVVFTSEDYGYPYAALMNSRHVQVDKARTVVPISGTAVRRNPLACWDYLEPVVRAYYVKRVCLVGAESTGKTTLAELLARHYNTVWVPEYGREFSEQKPDFLQQTWTTAEFVQIAAEQSRREDVAARQANRVLICDTDAFATSIWHRRYMGDVRSLEVEAIAAPRRYDLYLLTNTDIPFVQDGLRDGENIRQWMHETFLAELQNQQKPFALVSGTLEERMQQATKLIDSLLSNAFDEQLLA